MAKYTKFQEDLQEQLGDLEFKKYYERELRKLRLGQQIAAIRTKRKFTQKELAKRLKTSQGAITRLESGEYTGYSLRTLERIAAATGAHLNISLQL